MNDLLNVLDLNPSCPAPVLVPSSDESGAILLLNLDLFDDDLPPVFTGGQ